MQEIKALVSSLKCACNVTAITRKKQIMITKSRYCKHKGSTDPTTLDLSVDTKRKAPVVYTQRAIVYRLMAAAGAIDCY
ncbi:uncharacterized protein PHALS_14627 [Plasmopara halstedii]|uniref:Uncharacterized protein n=1 Tax=Plasmopara halstedii TaxID=4781 RepID=A0A0P1AN24_PLAHL|nr:uncharacterized protein PHALS_14627 [Plasmopara halstedii]CEG42441.1 hypothetical protein PHALS_14627 [Plasmopara halstedii]|eukprot:XP_024578810.1 hypothetical protein PHALS_14627 [Plasmopara halstedii]